MFESEMLFKQVNPGSYNPMVIERLHQFKICVYICVCVYIYIYLMQLILKCLYCYLAKRVPKPEYEVFVV